ncbi:MAG: sensor histidine kinase [Armatimonadota bacterium]|jgi:PAS domain S-box-containing protein
MLEFRMRMYLLGQNMRWVVIAVAAGVVTFGSPAERAHAGTIYVMLALASAYNMALWVIPWKRFEEQGRGNWIAVPYVVLDAICIGIVVYATGGIESNIYLAYLLLVVWMAIYPGMREYRWPWVIVVLSYFVSVFWEGELNSQTVYSFMMRTLIFGFVAWLTNQIARELNWTYSKLEGAVRDLTDGLVVVDNDDRVVLMNPRSAELLGVAEADAYGRRITDRAAPEGLAPLRKLIAPMEEAGDGGEGPVRCHEVIVESDRQRAVRVYTVPYHDEGGHLAGEMKVLHDVTDLKELDRLRADFISALTHDLCNPLGSVRTILFMLRRRIARLLEPESERMLRSVEDHTERLIRLTREMLDSARLEAGMLELHLDEVDLNELVTGVVEAIRWTAAAQGIELSHDGDPALPPVRADHDRLVRVLYNLVENAVKFTPAGGSVRIISERCPNVEMAARVSVCDTGPGIAPEQAEVIFQRFVRAGDELALKTRGSGLGLPICRELVAAHGGQLWVDSVPGQGSNFHFTVPFAVES